jgi:limonene 1,2-monooxygenase
MKFGIFMGPFHRVGENPTLALERDLELIQWLDVLGFDEAYIGEHHTAGWETIASPEVFIATAAERTRNIRLGTGVVSLPYHHPLMVANRMVLLDHLTRGRVILGVGPGALASDGLMLGIKPERQREMMTESLDIIMRLFTEEEPITYKSDWFELNEAVLQLRPYQQPHVPIAVASSESPSGVTLAGKHGAAVLSVSVPRDTVRKTSLKELWSIAEETAAEHNKVVRREDWGIVMNCHLAETREQAFNEVREGAARVVTEYYGETLGNSIPDVARDRIVDYMVEHNHWVVGTPDDCIAAIDRLQEISGGFGLFMIQVEDWAPRETLLRNYELLARYVMPHFQGALSGVIASSRWASERKEELQANRKAGLQRATETFYGGRR